MKKLILFSILHIVLLQTINSTPNLLATYEENKQKIFQIIKEHSRKYSQKLPKNYKKFIKDLNGLTKFKMTQIPISQLNNLKSKYGLPQELVNQLSNIKYSDKQIYSDVKFHILKSHSVLESIFGIAKREQNNEIFFAYIRGKTTGQLITQYITVSLRKCKRRWFRKKCWNENVNKPRGMKANELDIVKKALEYKFYLILEDTMNMDKKQIYKLFRNYANNFKINYPNNWNQILDPKSLKISIDYKTKEIALNNIQKDLSNIKLPNNIIKKINQLKLNNHIDFIHIFSQSPFNINLIYGVVLKTQKSIILSYIIGKGEVNINPINCKKGYLIILLAKNPKDCNKIITDDKIRRAFNRMITLNSNQVQNNSKSVFIGKFIELVRERLKGLDF